MAIATAIFLCFLTVAHFTATTLTCTATPLEEIEALTTFKANLDDPLGFLDGWDSATPSAPCDWHGILCYNKRVHQLTLTRLQLSGSISNSLSKLTQLRKLSLHNNNFTGSIPSSLSNCILLRAIYLHNNSLTGKLPFSLLNLTNLQVFNVAHNFLTGKVPGEVSNSLTFLDLSWNSFSDDIPRNFSSKSQMRIMNLSYNSFNGGIPFTIGMLQKLEFLYLDSNFLHGTFPSALVNCTNLVVFSAVDNFIGGLVPSTIGSMPKLKVLSLMQNRVSGWVPFSLLCNVGNKSSSLTIVELGFNAITGVSKPPNNEKCFTFLEVLDLKENHIHNTLFPSWLLTNATSLRSLDLSGNSFSGVLPVEVGNLVNLEELRLGSNSLSGKVPSEIVKCELLQVLDLQGNKFSGHVPSFFGELRSLKILSLGGNLFTGSVPKSYGTLSSLEVLDLSNNNLSGIMPQEIMRLSNISVLNLSNNKFSGQVLSNIGIGNLTALQVLNLSQCGFSGRVPSSVGSLMKLTVLDLSKQNLSGELPIELFGLPSLQVVELEENHLSGAVPEGFSSIVSLRYLNLTSNAFVGEIPATYGYLQSLVVLSLSHNSVSGSIPSEVGNCSQLQVLELESNHLHGTIPGGISHLSTLKELNLGDNRLSGDIPSEISQCSALNLLLLNGNHLTGRIPQSLSKLSNLVELNLSSNQLNREIPVNLSQISGLKYLNLSRNNLDGEIPEMLGSRFSDPSVYEINQSLLRWRKKLREGVTGEKRRSPNSASSGADRGRGSSENGGPKLVMFNGKITYAETIEATRHFDEENVLSRGRYGLVFKASYLDGMVLSIRRLPEGFINEAIFRKEAESLGKVKHRNLTVLRGYYAGPPTDVRLLVYDYMPNGNLGTLLQEASQQDGHVLNWPMRHLIALGIARGLAFLHSMPIVHGDVKPQNVLFDADFEAHLSEFGLERLTNIATPAEVSSSSTPIGSLGYVSPEAALTGQATKEADVYSFGIVLLEILTGRKPVMFTQDEDIVKWVKKQLQRGQISELLEPGLLELDPESSEWEEFLLGIKVALLCTAPDPLDRPSMTDIVFMLEGCRVGPEMPSSADLTTLPSPV
ncbi:unnamed protein product [Lupinus luteus]|uniref:Protein kinase domain-containing protein n=1 Tax=Lupinus luteus TaxID=3873 RepID=A0AAV1XQ35_LUPLU